MVKNDRIFIAEMVRPIYEANNGRPEKIMDRSQALSMLRSNLEHEEREDKIMKYDCGSLTPDQLAKAKELWCGTPKYMRGIEYAAILKIVEKQNWN